MKMGKYWKEGVNLSCVFFFYILTFPVSSFEANTSSSIVWTKGTNTIYSSTHAYQWIRHQMSSADFEMTIRETHLKQKTAINGAVCDVHENRIIASDWRLRGISIYDRKTLQETLVYQGSSAATVEHILNGSGTGIGQIAVDWRFQNVYWTDQGYSWIAVKSISRSSSHSGDLLTKKVIISTYIDKPTGISVSSGDNYIFWADAGVIPKIERTNLFGKERKIIIWYSLLKPSSLAIDLDKKVLYWTDNDRDTIEHSNFDGLNRKVLISNPGLRFYDVALFQEVILYTSETSAGFVYTKRNIPYPFYTDSFAFGQKQFERVLSCDGAHQPQRQTETCELAGCGNICVQNKQNYTMCSCPDGYSLMHDGSCNAIQNVLEQHIVFTSGNDICAVSIHLLGLEIMDALDLRCDIVTSNTDIVRFEVDIVKNVVIFTDSRYLYKQETFSRQRDIIYETRNSIEDMSYDWVAKQVYWIETDDSNIYYMDIDGKMTIPITKPCPAIFKLKRLITVPQNKKIYFIAENSTGEHDLLYIWDMKYDRIISADIQLQNVNDLEYDILFDRIFVLGESLHVGTNTGYHMPLKFENLYQGKNFTAITAYKKFIIATTNDGQINVVSLIDKRNFHVNVTSSGKTGPVQDVHIYDLALQPLKLDRCWINNGGCEHICLRDDTGLEDTGVDDRSVECACRLGYTLDTDNLSCKTADEIDTDFYVALDKRKGKMYKLNKKSNIPFAIDTGSSHVVAFSYYCKGNSIVWIENESGKQRLMMKVFGHSAVNMGDIELDNPSHVAVDNKCHIYISTRKEIRRFDLNNDSRTIIHTKNSSDIIRSIAASSNKRLISWIQVEQLLSKIMLANTDGSDIRAIRHTGRKLPDDIAFDPDPKSYSLFWCNSDLGLIERLDFDTREVHVISERMNVRPFAIDIIGGEIYAVHKYYGKIITLDKNKGTKYAVVLETPYLMISDFSMHFTTNSIINTEFSTPPGRSISVRVIAVAILIPILVSLAIVILWFKRRNRFRHVQRGPMVHGCSIVSPSFSSDLLYESVALNQSDSIVNEPLLANRLKSNYVQAEESDIFLSSTTYCLVGYGSKSDGDCVDSSSIETYSSSENLESTTTRRPIFEIETYKDSFKSNATTRRHSEVNLIDAVAKETWDQLASKKESINTKITPTNERPFSENQEQKSYYVNFQIDKRQTTLGEENNDKRGYEQPIDFDNGQDVLDGIFLEPDNSNSTVGLRPTISDIERTSFIPPYKVDGIIETARNGAESVFLSRGYDVPDCPIVDRKALIQKPNAELHDKHLIVRPESKTFQENKMHSIPKNEVCQSSDTQESDQIGSLSKHSMTENIYLKSDCRNCKNIDGNNSGTENSEQNSVQMENLKLGTENSSITLRKSFENLSSSSRTKISSSYERITKCKGRNKESVQRGVEDCEIDSVRLQVLKSDLEHVEPIEHQLRHNYKNPLKKSHVPKTRPSQSKATHSPDHPTHIQTHTHQQKPRLPFKRDIQTKSDIRNSDDQNDMHELKSVTRNSANSAPIQSLVENETSYINSGFKIVTGCRDNDTRVKSLFTSQNTKNSDNWQWKVEHLPQINTLNDIGNNYSCNNTDQTIPEQQVNSNYNFSKYQTLQKGQVADSQGESLITSDSVTGKTYEEERKSTSFCSVRSSCSSETNSHP